MGELHLIPPGFPSGTGPRSIPSPDSLRRPWAPCLLGRPPPWFRLRLVRRPPGGLAPLARTVACSLPAMVYPVGHMDKVPWPERKPHKASFVPSVYRSSRAAHTRRAIASPAQKSGPTAAGPSSSAARPRFIHRTRWGRLAPVRSVPVFARCPAAGPAYPDLQGWKALPCRWRGRRGSLEALVSGTAGRGWGFGLTAYLLCNLRQVTASLGLSFLVPEIGFPG